MIGFKHLLAFITVVEEKSFTNAANKLYQTQPALSIQIKNLENALQVKLIDRKEKEIHLTDAGAIFYPEAKRMLEVFAGAEEKIMELKGLKRGHLIIGASTLPGEYILPEVIGKFRKLLPGIELELKIADTGKVIEFLKKREVQVGFLGAVPYDTILKVQDFCIDELYLLKSQDWSGECKCDKGLLEHLILRERGSGTRLVVEDYLKEKLGLPQIKPRMEVGSTRAIINMVAAGMGVSFVSRWAAEEAIKLGKVKVVDCPENCIRRTIYGAVLQHAHLSFAAQAFWQLAMDTGV